uniref:RING-type domain-containing protein n=1 Tax=Gadus morhua TaxID=8049 RepID=A0A8C4ZQ33_GADMO
MAQDRYCCSICLDLYCLDCITGHWDNEEDVYSCPQCRQTFEPRPALVKNTVLTDVLEDLKRTQLRDMKAIRSCLGCQASFCEEHLQGHYQVPGWKRHKLVEPTADLQDNICPRHDELIRMLCCQEQQSICCVCAVYEHRGLDMISVEAERNKRKEDLSSHQKTTRTRIQKGWEVLHHC